MQMTTREAVREALECLGFVHTSVDCTASRKQALSAARVLCDHYGFKLEQFFDVKEPA